MKWYTFLKTRINRIIAIAERHSFATTSQKARNSSQKDGRPTRDEEREDYDGRIRTEIL